jgi:hypothetical protein
MDGKLTDVAVKKAKPADKPRTMFDGGGLYLQIEPSGGKLCDTPIASRAGKEYLECAFESVIQRISQIPPLPFVR